MGETDIFGQLKQAWSDFTAKNLDSSVHQALCPIIQNLFTDTKEIRAEYLEGMGGSSYGTLVRRLVSPQEKDEILFLGAGQLAESVLPYFSGLKLRIWNRNPEKSDHLIEKLRNEFQLHLEKETDEIEGWRRARHVVICIPPHRSQDSKRIETWKNKNSKRGVIVHLGTRRFQSEQWKILTPFFDLDHVFELEKSQRQIRSIQIAQATKACEERAMLRALGESVSLPHGWEDLAVFN